MKTDDGNLSFGTAIDMTGFEQGMSDIEQRVQDMGSKVQVESEKIGKLFENVPAVNIEFVTDAAQSLSTIDAAFAQIDSVVDENKAAIRELEAEYQRLSEVQSAAEGTDEATSLEQTKQAIQENIELRKQVIEAAAQTADELSQTEARLRAEAEAFAVSGTTIREQLGQIGAACEQHEQALARLEEEQKALTSQMSKAYTSGNDKEYNVLRKKLDALKKEQSERKKALSALREQSNELENAASKQEKENSTVEQATQKHASLRQQIKALKDEMADLVANGIDEQSEKYRELTRELGRLQDIQSDIQQQGSVLANDEAQFAGVMSGLQGVAGGYTALQGAMSLVVGENEDLQKVMLKVQSLMSITMGLQQLSTALNKDSAFMLVTVNGLKEYWNKLLAIGAGEQAIATEAEIAETAAEAANSVATTANTAAKQGNAVATGEATASTAANTTGQVANTGAAVAGTAANIGLAGAFRMVAAAIASIPLFGWIAAAVSALAGAVVYLTNKSDEAIEKQREANKYLEEGNKAYADAASSIKQYQARIESFNGSKQQETKLVNELNQKFGTEMGYCKSLVEWKQKLTEKAQAYCEALMAEANASALAAEAAKLYVEAMNLQDQADNNTYERTWLRTDAQDKAATERESKELLKQREHILEKMREQAEIAARIRSEASLGGYTDPSSSRKGRGKVGGSSFDPKKAALDAKKAIEDYEKSVKSYLHEANEEIVSKSIEGQREGVAKQVSAITLSVEKQKEAWNNKLKELGAVRKKALHDIYMSKKGATEVGWAESEAGKKSDTDYANDLLKNKKIAEEYQQGLAVIEENGQKQIQAVRQKYADELIEQYGSTAQKMELLERRYMETLSYLPTEYLAEAEKQHNAAVSALLSDDFKKSIDWDAVFGNLSEQSLPALELALQKVQQYFKQNAAFMDEKTVKDYSEAIAKMQDEIADRNPFTALHNSLQKMKDAKNEYIVAVAEMKAENEKLTLAQQEYNTAFTAMQEILSQIQSGELVEGCEQQTAAQEELTRATQNYQAAQARANAADARVISSRNNLSSTYKNFSNNLKRVGSVTKDVGSKAKALADVFGDDIADSIGKALDFIEDVLGATQSVISAIGDVGKSVASDVASTVQSSSNAMQGASQAAATSIKTVEKASVILTVISAALQVATAIANLFNNDDKKQKEIEALQERIDQLQWELDNAEAVRIREQYGDAYERVKKIINETTEALIQLKLQQYNSTSVFARYWARATTAAEAYRKSVEKIADEYARLSYTADKALGSAKYDEARAQLENLAEQQLLLQKQIDKENSKKKTDSSKISDWKNTMNENAQEMAALINELVEDIIGSTAEDIAQTLGDAFFDAVASGEDAMEQWKTKANEIIRDVVKNMLVTKFLEEPIGQIFDKYKKKWFGDDGRFAGIDTVIASMTDLSKDLDDVGEMFNSIYEQLPAELTELLSSDAERTGTEKGIATASQDSVDENNARLTTIQGHTYTLVQGVTELNATSNAILERVTGIERNTDQANTKLDTVSKNLRDVRNTLDDIQTRGLRINT